MHACIKTILFIGAVSLLTSCRLFLGGIEDRTDATKAEVEKTNRGIDRTNDNMGVTNNLLIQSINQLGHMERLSIFSENKESCVSPERASNVRVRDCQIMFVYGDIHGEDKIYQYLGAKSPVTFPTVAGTLNGRNVIFRNTSLFSKDAGQRRSLNSDLYEILREACWVMQDSLARAIKTKTLSIDEYEMRTEKLIYIGTTVLGSGESDEALEIADDGVPGATAFIESESERLRFADSLKSLHAAVGLAQKDPNRPNKPYLSDAMLQTLVESRLGVRLVQ